MIKRSFLTLLFLASFFAVNSQNVITIDGEGYSKDEFNRLFLKNNDNAGGVTDAEIKDYVELFINYKLKVLDAKGKGLDTLKSFKDEFKSYRTQLSQPYFVDETINEHLVKEAYDRMQYDIRASHILINCDANASAKDTLIAYKKISDIRKRALKGEDFGMLAVELSDDRSARDMPATAQRGAMKGNKGDLGYFTVFSMVYPFETGAYNTKVGGVSEIIRTEYGYHLINVVDRKPAMNKVQLAHIFFRTQGVESEADVIEKRVDSVYKMLISGDNFEELVKKYSDDTYSAQSGGVLPLMGCNRMLPEFAQQIYMLKDGEISRPIKTDYGWHIIKLIDKQELQSYDDMYGDLKQQVMKDVRADKSKDAILLKIKSDFGFKDYPKSITEMASLSDSLMQNKWKVSQANGMNKELFSVVDKSWNQNDLAIFVADNQRKYSAKSNEAKMYDMYKAFVDASLLNYYDERLESLFPDFKYLVQEYYDGILLFEVMDREIWNKAVVDTVGLEVFYDTNKTKYMWGERLKVSVYKVENGKVLKKLQKLAASGKSDEEIEAAMTIKKKGENLPLGYKVVTKMYSKGDDIYVDSLEPKVGLTDVIDSSGVQKFAFVHGVVAPEPKKLDEARGIIVSDYQNYLEQEWINNLRASHKIEINYELLK